jgi:hypothetical protein
MASAFLLFVGAFGVEPKASLLRGSDLAGLDLVEQIQAPKAPCTCGGDRPCQHTSGSSCYPMMHSPSGALQCPSETNHCECECTAGAPCYMGHGEKGCVGTYIMYGTEVCPVGSKRCHAYYAGTPAPAPVPVPAAQQGSCSNCDLKRPCKKDSMVGEVGEAECVPYFLVGALVQCPTGTTLCDQHHAAAVSHIKSFHKRCRCGGGKPCQYTLGSDCFAKGLDTDGITLRCPDHTTECDCTCGVNDASRPCQVTELGENFCWGTASGSGNGVCPAETLHCKVFPPATQVSHLLSAEITGTATAAPTPWSVTKAPTPAPTHTNLGDCTAVLRWGPWTPCSRECGRDDGTGEWGTRTRAAVRAEPQGCSAPVQTTACNKHDCLPVDCQFTWPEEWSHCSYSCNPNPAVGSAAMRVAMLTESETGGKDPIGHVYGAGADAGSSPRAGPYHLGVGYRYKRPLVTVAGRDGGKACPVPLRQPCNLQACVAPHKKCSCDPFRTAKAHPDALQPSIHDVSCVRRGGIINVKHPPSSIFYTCAYNSQAGCTCCVCDVIKCHTGAWGAWSSCDVNTGMMTRQRVVPSEIFIKEECPTLTEYSTCSHAHDDTEL